MDESRLIRKWIQLVTFHCDVHLRPYNITNLYLYESHTIFFSLPVPILAIIHYKCYTGSSPLTACRARDSRWAKDLKRFTLAFSSLQTFGRCGILLHTLKYFSRHFNQSTSSFLPLSPLSLSFITIILRLHLSPVAGLFLCYYTCLSGVIRLPTPLPISSLTPSRAHNN